MTERLTERLELASPPPKIYRVAKFEDAWTRRPPDRISPSACRFDDPLGLYRTIYAAETRYAAYLAALLNFRPSGISNLQAKKRNANLPDTPDAHVIRQWISKRYIGEASLTGQFADLTRETSVAFLRHRLTNDFFAKHGISNLDVPALIRAPHEVTREISRCIWELEAREEDNRFRFDGLSYLSRVLGIRRWAIFDKNPIAMPGQATEPLDALEPHSSEQIVLDDPDLIRALADCGIPDSESSLVPILDSNAQDVQTLFNLVFDDFEDAFAVEVSDEARAALLRPALKHESEIIAELKVGALNITIIRDRSFAQLRVALNIAKQRTINDKEEAGAVGESIEGRDAAASMNKQCEWLFWC